MTARDHPGLIFPLEGDDEDSQGTLASSQDLYHFRWNVPCSGCGEHFLIDGSDLVYDSCTPRSLALYGIYSIRPQTFVQVGPPFVCFRCKARLEAEEAAALGELQ